MFDIKGRYLSNYDTNNINLFLVKKDNLGILIKKIYAKELENGKYSVDISNYDIKDYTKEEIESIINKKILSLKKK